MYVSIEGDGVGRANEIGSGAARAFVMVSVTGNFMPSGPYIGSTITGEIYKVLNPQPDEPGLSST